MGQKLKSKQPVVEVEYINKIINLGTAAIGDFREASEIIEAVNGIANSKINSELGKLLYLKNGFYAFEGALHVFPLFSNDESVGLLDWNSKERWKARFENELIQNIIAFAEDIFGNQFCIAHDSIHFLDVETLSMQTMAASMDEWAKKLIEDYNYYTGYSLGKAWQTSFGKLEKFNRLVAKKPFFLGGDYTVDNLYSMNADRAMNFRASVYNQVKDVPDGTPVKIRLENE